MNCNSCGKELAMNAITGRHRRYDDYPQYDDALIIDLHGGYGMYLDFMAQPLDRVAGYEGRSVICKTCADKLISDYPWLVRPYVYQPDQPVMYGTTDPNASWNNPK